MVTELKNFKRKELFDYFNGATNPFIILTTKVDVTNVVEYCNQNGKFYATLGYLITKTANGIDGFKYRYHNGKFYYCDKVNSSYTQKMYDDSIGFFGVDFSNNFHEYKQNFVKNQEKCLSGESIEDKRMDEVWMSCVPWFSFSGLVPPFNKEVTIPQFIWGKYQIIDGRYFVDLMIMVHHGFIDGFQIGEFIKLLEENCRLFYNIWDGDFLNYIDIVMDEFIRETFLKIDKENNSYISHGMQHTLNVVENIEKIAKILDIDETTLNYLKIAGYLHDIGRIYGDYDHYLKSRDFVYKYLNGKIEEVWFNKILSAIQRHHEKENVAKLPLFEHIVLFADKMDFSCKRIVDNSDEYFESKVLGIDFAINKNRNVFIIILKVSDPLVSEEFSQWHMYNKVLKRIVQFAEKLNMDYEIKFVS